MIPRTFFITFFRFPLLLLWGLIGVLAFQERLVGLVYRMRRIG